MVFLSALTLLVPHFSAIRSLMEFNGIQPFLLDSPILLLGAFDLAICFLLALAFTELFPLIRLRASIGFGFCLYYFFALQAPSLMIIYTLGYLGLFICTISLNPFVLIPAIIIGLISFGSLVVKAIIAFIGG